jgi:fructokinase
MSGLLAALHRHGLAGARRRQELHAMTESEVTAILGFATSLAAITVGRAGANPPHLPEVTTVR